MEYYLYLRLLHLYILLTFFFFPARDWLAHPWPLTSSTEHRLRITCWTFPAFLCFLHILVYFLVLVFSSYLSFASFFFVSSVSSCTRTAVVTQHQLKQQQQYNNNSSRYIKLSRTSVSTSVRQRKQARTKVQVMCCRGPAMYFVRVPFFLHSFFIVPSSFKANRQQLIRIFQSTGNTQPCDRPAVQTMLFLVWISV